MERKLRLQLAEAYEAGAEDGYHNIADKETRDTYVEGVMKK